MELLREAAGMVPGLEKMAFHSWCYLFYAWDFLCVWLSFPADKCWYFPVGPII